MENGIVSPFKVPEMSPFRIFEDSPFFTSISRIINLSASRPGQDEKQAEKCIIFMRLYLTLGSQVGFGKAFEKPIFNGSGSGTDERISGS